MYVSVCVRAHTCICRGEGVGQIGFLSKLCLLARARALTLCLTCPVLGILLAVVGKGLILAAGSFLECFAVTRRLGQVRFAAPQSKGHGAESDVVARSCDTAHCFLLLSTELVEMGQVQPPHMRASAAAYANLGQGCCSSTVPPWPFPHASVGARIAAA